MLAIILLPGIQLRLFLKMQAAGFFIPGRLQNTFRRGGQNDEKILIAEDEDVIRDFVIVNLRRAGYVVTDVDNGEKVWMSLRKRRGFDVVLWT